MLSVVLSALLGVMLGAWGSLVSWSLGGVAVVFFSVIFVVATAASWLFPLGAILAYSFGMFVGLAVAGPLRRANGVARAELGPFRHR